MTVYAKFFHIALSLVLSFAMTLSGTETVSQKESKQQDRERMLFLLSGEWVSRALYVATKLEIADHLLEGERSVEDLAKKTNSHPESLYRLLHTLAGFHVFEEIAPRVFVNTNLSCLLAKASPDTLRALSLFYGEDIHKSWDGLLPSVQTGTPAFDLSFKQPVFSYFKDNPSRGRLFQEAMKEKSWAVIESALASYDFGQFKSVYDIGGGYGQFMKALLQYYPGIYGMLFELPEVIASIEKQPSPIQENNCSLVSGDFFTSIPKGGDAYLLKSVLHDWDDEKCSTILTRCHESMGPDSRLLIIEVVLQPNQESVYANCMDLLMLAVTGGKERDLESFKQLLDRSGFILERVYPTGTEFSILEVRKAT